jgi:hypothetical protein
MKQRLTESELMRKYSNLITESEQLNEGLIDSITKQAKALISKLSPGILEKITGLVQTALGKSISQLTMADVNMTNIKKVLAANGASPANSLEKNRAGAAKVGGVLGAVSTLLAMSPGIAAGATFGLTGAALIAGMAIVVALLARETAEPDTMPDPNPPTPQEPFAGNPEAQALYKAKMKAAAPELDKLKAAFSKRTATATGADFDQRMG